MLTVIIQMAGLIVCGIVWRMVKPAGLDHAQTRKVLTTLVYYLLLPALVLSVLWKAELGANSFFIAIAAAIGVLAGLLLSYISCRFCKSQAAVSGAIILAVAFPNSTYLGLPVLEATFGSWARGVAIQYDLFACTPLLFTAGILLAAHFGSTHQRLNIFRELLQIPPLWAAGAALVLNIFNVPMPEVVGGLLTLLERGVVPLMLFSLGLSLSWRRDSLSYLRPLLPVVALRLFIIPAIVLAAVNLLGVGGELRAAIVIETAMPSMVIGIVICDRFNLDVGIYATAVTVTTVVSMLTLPLWYQWLM
ncbi:MAG: AEC family transporter [Gammaproteobacteria bacterium]|nr:AEC family transporter [Gammaproteobacteria bacterium]